MGATREPMMKSKIVLSVILFLSILLPVISFISSPLAEAAAE